MTTHRTLRIDVEDVAVIELACEACRTAVTLHLATWSSAFPARCPNCDEDWYLGGGQPTPLRRLCDALKSLRRDTGRPYHVRLVFERPVEKRDG